MLINMLTSNNENSSFKFDPLNILPKGIKDSINPVIQPFEQVVDQVYQPLQQVVKPITSAFDGVLDFAGNAVESVTDIGQSLLETASGLLDGSFLMWIAIAGGVILAIFLFKK